MRFILTILFAWTLSSSTVGHADSLRARVEGQCPSQTMLVYALGEVGVAVEESSSVKAHVTSENGVADLSLADDVHGEFVVRHVVSADCAAIAEVFALIIADSMSLANRPRKASNPVAADLASPPKSNSPPRRVERVVTPQPLEIASPRSRVLHVGFSSGVSASAAYAQYPAFLQADVGLSLESMWLRVALTADASSADVGADLSRRQYGARVEVGSELGSASLWLRPTAGLGLMVSSVSSPLPDRANLIRMHPAFSVGLTAGVALSDSISIRSVFEGLLYPIADRYTSEMRQVGASPRGVVHLGLGLEWHGGV